MSLRLQAHFLWFLVGVVANRRARSPDHPILPSKHYVGTSRLWGDQAQHPMLRESILRHSVFVVRYSHPEDGEEVLGNLCIISLIKHRVFIKAFRSRDVFP